MSTELWLTDANSISQEISEPIVILRDGSVVLGRDEVLADICVVDDGISRQHVLISKFEKRWFVRDLGSTNGTFVNGKKINEGEWSLVRDKDSLLVSDIKFGIGLGGTLSENFFESSLHVFNSHIYIGEFNADKPGRLFSLVKRGKELFLTKEHPKFPGIVFESSDDYYVSIDVDTEYKEQYDILLNGVKMEKGLSLKDRDNLKIDNYQFLFESIFSNNTRTAEKINSAFGLFEKIESQREQIKKDNVHSDIVKNPRPGFRNQSQDDNEHDISKRQSIRLNPNNSLVVKDKTIELKVTKASSRIDDILNSRISKPSHEATNTRIQQKPEKSVADDIPIKPGMILSRVSINTALILSVLFIFIITGVAINLILI